MSSAFNLNLISMLFKIYSVHAYRSIAHDLSPRYLSVFFSVSATTVACFSQMINHTHMPTQVTLFECKLQKGVQYILVLHTSKTAVV